MTSWGNRARCLVGCCLLVACAERSVERSVEPLTVSSIRVATAEQTASDDYWTPLTGMNARLGMPAGKSVVFDVHDAPNGERWATESRTSAEDEASYSTFTGLVTVPRRRLTSKEKARLDKDWSGRQTTPLPKIDAALSERIAIGNSSSERVVVRLSDLDEVPLFRRLQMLVADGAIASKSDYAASRADLVAERQRRIATMQTPVLAELGRLGAKNVTAMPNSNLVVADVPLSTVSMLAKFPGVVSIEMDQEGRSTGDVDGGHVAAGTQLAQFNYEGWDGEQGSGTTDDIAVALIDACGVDDEHPGFTDAGVTPRIRSRWLCGSYCTLYTNFSYLGAEDGCLAPMTDHATAVAGLLLGDLLDDQDSLITTDAAQKARSGYAGEVQAYIYDLADLNVSSAQMAMDNLRAFGASAHLLNMSWSSDAFPTCAGTDSFSRSANLVFEDGILPIIASGNDGDGSSNCTVRDPGGAVGVFTVGATGFPTLAGSAATVRNTVIRTDSSHGALGQRTTLDLTAHGCRTLMFDSNGGYTNTDCGTSFAAPTVAAAAADFVDWYKTNVNDAIDDPGLLFANLLVMGDRQGISARRTWAADRFYGNGRLQARKYDGDGMDSPFAYANNSLCVDDGEVVSFVANGGNALSADVDYYKAALYWYDGGHDDGLGQDRLLLELRDADTNALIKASTANEEKQFIFVTGVGGRRLRLDVIGHDVTSDGTGCGTNSMLAYVARFWEDGDRDDADGPTAAEVVSEQ